MRSLIIALALASVALAPASQAQVRFLPYVGYSFGGGYDFEEIFEGGVGEGEDLPESGGFLVGLGAEFGVTPGFLPIALKVRPSVEAAFLSGYEVTNPTSQGGGEIDVSQSLTQINLDVLADFSPPMAPVGIHAGVGAAFAMYNADSNLGTDDLDDSAFGANLLAGLTFGGGFIQPFVEGRYTLMTLQPGSDDVEGEYPDENEISRGFSVLAGVSIGL